MIPQVFASQKPEAENRHGGRFSAAQGIEAEIPQTPRLVAPPTQSRLVQFSGYLYDEYFMNARILRTYFPW
jgi:hypothetical protein